MGANGKPEVVERGGHEHHPNRIGRTGHEMCSLAPPDGGWSWVILFSVVAVTVMSPSIVGCFGIILPDVQRSMKTTVSQAALVPTLAQSLNNLSAPLAAVLGLAFSFRKVGIIGGLLISMGICLTYFATSIEAVYLTIGLLGGLGFGLANKAGLFVVNEYFDRRRGLATGTYYAGAAVCRLVFPVIVQRLLHEYSYPGAVLVWGGILANICVVSSLYQPVKWHLKHVPGPGCPDYPTPTVVVSESGAVAERDNDSKMESDVRAKSTASLKVMNSSFTQESSQEFSCDNDTEKDMCESQTDGSIKHGIVRWLSIDDKAADLEAGETDSFLSSGQEKQDGWQNRQDVGQEKLDGGQRRQDGGQEKQNGCGPVSRKVWRRSASAVSIASGILSNHDVGDVLASRVSCNGIGVPTVDDPSLPHRGCCCRWMHKCVHGLDFSIFRQPAFYVVCASSVFHSFATVNAYVFLPLLGRSRGLGDSAAFLLSSIGIGEIVGRLIIPWLRDLKLLSAKYAYMTGAAIAAISAFGITFTDSFAIMVTLSILLGVGAGAMVGLGSVLCVEAVGLELLPSAISFQQFFQGAFTLPSGLILGWIRDVTGNYTQSFYVMAAIYSGSFWVWVVSGIVSFVSDRRRQNRDKR